MRIVLVDRHYVEVVNLNGDKLVWDIAQYHTTKQPIVEELFTEINGFFQSLTDEAQNKIWEDYSEIYEYLELSKRSDVIEMPLRKLVKQIYSHIPWDALNSWMRTNRKLKYPEVVRDEHDPNDKAPDKTYLRSEYWNLAVFAIWLRPMFPIWGEYMKIIESESGKKTKEYYAFRIIGDTDVFVSDAFYRLKRYIESMADFHSIEKADIVSITASLSSSELLPWMMYNAIIRRICGGLIDAEETGHLVSSTYTHISGLLNKVENRFGTVNAKSNNSNTDEADKPVADRIRSRQDQSILDMALSPVYMNNRVDCIMAIDDTVPPEMIGKLVEGGVDTLEPFQLWLASQVLSLVMSPKGVHSMVARRIPSKDTNDGMFTLYDRIVKNPEHDALLIVRVLLWHWGYKFLALLITAERSDDDDIMATENSDRISVNTVAELNKIYHHMVKKKLTNDRQRNVAYVNIMSKIREIGQGAWVVKIPEGEQSSVAHYLDAKGRAHVPSDIAEQLARLAIHISQLRKSRKES